MSFTYSPLPLVPQEQAGMGNMMLQRAMQQYMDTNKMMYQRPQLEAALQNTQGQTGLYKSQAGLNNKQNQWYDKNISAQIALRQAQQAKAQQEADKMAFLLDLYKKKYHNTSNQEQYPSQNYPEDGQQMGYDAPQGAQMVGENQPMGSMQQSPQGMPMPQQNGVSSQVQQLLYGATPQQQAQQQPQQPMQQQPQLGGPNAQMVSATMRNAPYGIPVPTPSVDDLANKDLFGIDTFGNKSKEAYKLIENERKAYDETLANTETGADAALEQNQLLDRFNAVADKGGAGMIQGRLPAATAEAQELNNIIADMQKDAVKKLKSAMGEAKFSNLDMNVAALTKPSRTWTPETRRFYTDFTKQVNERMQEKAEFFRVASNPSMGVPIKTAKAAWETYQKQHPIVASERNKELNTYIPDSWKQYLSPEALRSIQKTGTYKPAQNNKVNIQQQITMPNGAQGPVKINGRWYHVAK